MNKKRKKLVSAICLIMVVLMLLSLIVSVIPVRAYGDEAYEQSLDALKKKRDAITAQITDVSKKLEALEDEKTVAIDKKIALEQRNACALEELEIIEKEVALYTKMVEQKAEELKAAQQRESVQLSKYRTRVRAMEETGSINILTLILNSKSFSELLSAIDDYGDVMNSDKVLADRYEEARLETEAVKSEYEDYKAQVEDSQKELQEKQKQLEQEIAETEELLEQLAQEIEAAEEEKRKAEEQEMAAANNITAFIAQYLAQQQAARQQSQQQETAGGEEGGYSEESYSEGGSGDGGYSGGATGTGSFAWPVPSSHRVSSCFKERWGKQHTGIDIDGFGLDGNPVVASDGGTVIMAAYNGGYGNCVIIDHGNGYQTVYAHLSGFAVSQGSYVGQGQTVGYLGSTGNSSGTHCHFEIRYNGSYTDPLPWFGGYELEPGAAD